MAQKGLDMLQLEKKVAMIETDALVEEKQNAKENYAALDAEMTSLEKALPYPDVGRYDVGNGYDEIEALYWKKKDNEPTWDKMDILSPYCEKESLYCGHVNYGGPSDYYFIDGSPDTYATKQIGDTVWLINVDDRKYKSHVDAWRYPAENGVFLSRNIVMRNRNVTDVDIVLDKGSELHADITDAYLRKALIRNKRADGVQSIIQTIQKKQDNIRSLPVDKSFIVQGCAGSGKTMVLLHRLRYLIYNKDIRSGEYVFLVPGFRFKEFIGDISAQFKIDNRSILPYQTYYRQLMGDAKAIPEEDVNELVFSPDFLAKVYAKEFMQENYRTLFKNLFDQTERLIAFCEDKLNGIVEEETKLAENELRAIPDTAVQEMNRVAERVIPFISVPIVDMQSAKIFSTTLCEKIEKAKAEHDKIASPNYQITIDPNDERIVGNPQLAQLKAAVDSERNLYAKALVFTKAAHKNKLDKLEGEYSELYRSVELSLIEQEKERLALLATLKADVFDGISIEDASAVLSAFDGILEKAEQDISNAEDRKNNVITYIDEKYKDLISQLNGMISLSTDIIDRGEAYVESLTPSIDFIEGVTKAGNSLLYNITRIAPKSEDRKASEHFGMFATYTPQQRQAHMNTLLLNACKRSIKNQFGICICDDYKHYWYIALYCRYLTYTPNWATKKEIFIDECQDLSASEIELLYKINNAPVMNLFGDKNQSITEYGISDWSSIHMVSDVFELNENFRNTNQIVDYCNANLPFTMRRIGVDMDPVQTYASLEQAVEACPKIRDKAVFIIKNEYAKKDLLLELEDKAISDFSIYTVKEAKGFEFAETFVIDLDMTDHEKYIAYTRALVQMCVITSLPYHTDRSKPLYKEGIDEEGLSEEPTAG